MCLVWVISNAAQLSLAGRPSVASADISIHHHSEPGMSTSSQARRRSLISNVIFQVQQPETSTETMQGLPGGTNWRKNFLCRTLSRCLLVQELASSPPYDSPGVPVAAAMDIPPMTLPILPTDPEAPPPPPPRTNPSTLLTPNSHPSGSRSRGDGGTSMQLSKDSNMASKVGITAGVGVSGILLLMAALLYYFKPDIFMCCKTCVRVQVFHHNHPTK